MGRGSRWLQPVLLVVPLSLIALVYLVPLLWTLASALRPSASIYGYVSPLTLRTFLPEVLTLENFVHIFAREGFGRPLLNSFLVSALTILFGVAVNSMAGFALARFSFPGKRIAFFLVLVTFMVPFESIVIPLYILVRRLGFINTYAALVVPAVGNGLAIFLFRQFFAEVPRELLEAGRADGASWPVIFGRILLPLSLPAIVTVMVMIFMFQWNALFWPLVAAYSSRYQVAQVAVAAHRMTEETHWATLFSSAIAASLPPMLLFLGLQRYYVRGISQTGFK
jgi:ABC-type glycerol-3-phosphate transport system permease component